MSEFVQALVPWVAGAVMAMLFVDAVLTVIKIIRGPSVLTRTLASDLLVSTLICAIGAEMVLSRHSSSMPLLISLALVAFVGTVAVARFVARDSDDDGAAARERRLRHELAKRKLDSAVVADIRHRRDPAPSPWGREMMVPMLSENVAAVFDLIALVCILVGAMLCVAASIGLLRFPDILSRQHAATKPQVLGVLLVLLAVALTQRSVAVFTMVSLVAVFQLLTAPVSSQLMSRAAVRTSQVELGRVEADPINPAHPLPPKKRRAARDTPPGGKPGENPESTAPQPD